jgi:hypothetical protein
MRWARLARLREEIDARYIRSAEVDHLLADPSKARSLLNWEPCVTFSELVNMMVHADLRELERTLKGGVPALAARFSTNGAKIYSMPAGRVKPSLGGIMRLNAFW